MPKEYKQKWMEKSTIDYFNIFLSLWLAFNSWYKSHYSEITGTDRSHINKVKTDFSGRNHLWKNFNDLIAGDDKTGIAFRINIELLHYSLVRATLKPENIKYCSFLNAVPDYDDKENPENLIKNPKINKDGSVHASDELNVILLDKIYITSDLNKFFSGLFEIIYQVRNMLVHGGLNPDKDEHEVVKYCYLILWDLMN